MRLLYINDTYKRVGGTEMYLHSLSNIFRGKGHEMFLFAIDDEKEITKHDLFVYRDKFKRNPFKYILWYYLNPSLYRRLRNWIKKVNPDVIHIHNNGKFTSSILLALLGFNIPVVQTVHDHTPICPTSLCTKLHGEQCDGGFGIRCPMSGCISWARYAYQRVPEYIKQYLLKTNVNLFIAPSRALERRLIKYGIRNVAYLPSFVYVMKFEYDINQMETGNVLYVGRLAKEKGVHYLIKALPKIVKAYSSCMLNIVGDGPMMSDLLKLVRDLDIEKHVTIHGKLFDDALMAAYQKANVVVIPSACVENSPIVAYETMALGRPIVGSDIGGIPDLVVDGETGFLVEPRNPDQIAEKVIRILSNTELGIRMGKNARENCITKYNHEEHYKKLMRIYEKVKHASNYDLRKDEQQPS